jgi:uncharacterized protein (TIGR00730 family)
VSVFKSVCVFCGSQPGARPEYAQAARELGRWLAQHSIELVFGGGHVGLMGEVSDAALAAGGRVVGIIPEHLRWAEPPSRTLTELHVVDSMHTRKRMMAEREETFEMVTWLQLQLQAKPVGIVNVEGYYDHLLRFLRHAADEGFIRPQHWDLLIVESSISLLLARLALHAEQMQRAHPQRGSTGQS